MALDRRLLTALLTLLLVANVPRPAQAQFGYFFGGPEPMRRAPRRRVARPAPVPDEIPLPVPRPRFPDDPPAAGEVAPEPVKPTPPKPEPFKPEPLKTELPKPVVPAEPDIAAPAKIKPIQPEPDIAAPAEKRPLPGETAPEPRVAPKPSAPLPPERPPERDLKPSLPAETAPAPEPPKPAEMSKPTPPADIKPNSETKPVGPAAPAQPASPPPADAPVPTPPAKPPELAKPSAPTVAPSGARLGEAPGQPDDDATCQDRLKARDVEIEPIDIGPQPDPRCTVVRALKLKGLTLPGGGKVSFPEKPTVACTTADAFSLYVRDLLSPLANGTFGTPVVSVWTGPGLECRSRDHIFGAKLSAHGQGLAIDIAQIKLGDGKMIEVGSAKDDLGQNFETAARSAACGYFHTVLGPGSDSYHRTHWHFDLEVRGSKGDTKYCK